MTPQPALDPYLTSIGEPVEDLSRIMASQPFRSVGPSLDRADLEALVAAGRPALLRRSTPPALVEADLMDGRGRLTDSGRSVHAMLTAADGRLRVESVRGSTPLVLDVYVRQGWALTVSTRSPAAIAEPPRGQDIVTTATRIGLDHVDAARVPMDVAAWVGLAPAWSLATEPVDVPEALLRRRVDDPTTPPAPDADAHLRYVWQQPWFLWTLQASGSTSGRIMVNAGRAGHFALTTPDGGPAAAEAGLVGFRAMPSAAVWRDLVHLAAVAAGTPLPDVEGQPT